MQTVIIRGEGFDFASAKRAIAMELDYVRSENQVRQAVRLMSCSGGGYGEQIYVQVTDRQYAALPGYLKS